MSLQQTICFSYKWLTFWIALFIVEGKDPSSLLLKENRDVMVEFTKTEDKSTANTERSVECGLRKLTKRSSSFDASWLQDEDSRETNCQIFSITTVSPPVITARTTTQKSGKVTTRHVAAAGGSWLLPFWYYYPPRKHAFYRAFYPYNRGANVYRPIWYSKFQRDDSSEEKRR